MKQEQSDDVGRFFPSRSFPRLALESDVGRGGVLLGWTDPSATSEGVIETPADTVSGGATPAWAAEEPTVERAVTDAVVAAREQAFRTVRMSNEQLLGLLDGCRPDVPTADVSGEEGAIVDLPTVVPRRKGHDAQGTPPRAPTCAAEPARRESPSLFVGDLTVAESPVALRARRAAKLNEDDLGRGEASTELAVLLVEQQSAEHAPADVVPAPRRSGDLGGTLVAEARPTEAAARPDARRSVDVEVDVARRVADPRRLGDALESLARSGDLDAVARGGLFVEAAYGALDAGDMATAISRAGEAARVAPDRWSTLPPPPAAS